MIILKLLEKDIKDAKILIDNIKFSFFRGAYGYPIYFDFHRKVDYIEDMLFKIVDHCVDIEKSIKKPFDSLCIRCLYVEHIELINHIIDEIEKSESTMRDLVFSCESLEVKKENIDDLEYIMSITEDSKQYLNISETIKYGFRSILDDFEDLKKVA
jgi:hypothetical protein